MNLDIPKRGRDVPKGSPDVGVDSEFSPYIRSSADTSRQCSRIENDATTHVSDARESQHPFEVNYEVNQPKRGSHATRSLDHGRQRRHADLQEKNRSHSEEELGYLVESGCTGPRVGGKNSRGRSIEDFLPSRLAACDGTRTVAFRRSRRSRRRRSGKTRRREDDVELVAFDAAVEDAVDSSSGIQVELNEEMTIGELKCCATTMERKKRKREQLLDQARTTQSGLRRWLPTTDKALLRRWRQNAASLSQHFELWTSSFKQIEGKFGASVFSYFVFVRLLFFMNLFMTLVIIAAIIVPQLSIHSFRTNCVGINASDSAVLWKSCDFSNQYHQHMEEIRANSSAGDIVADFFKGTGWMENSSLFFGFYWNEQNSSTRYNMALAYLLTTAFYLAAILIFMVIYTGKGLKERMLHRGDQPSNAFERVFCGWDYSLCQPTSAKEKHKSIYRELDKIYTRWKMCQSQVTLTCCDKLRLFCTRAFVHVLVIAQLFGAGAAIALTITTATPQLQSMKFVQDRNFLDLMVSFLPSFVLILLNIILPVIFRNIVRWEKYSEENELQITLFRTVFLRLASIAALVITVVVQVHDCKEQPCRIPNFKVLVVHCWETYMGQAIYRLVILDFAMVVMAILLFDFPLNYLVKRFPTNCLLKMLGQQEFDVPQNVIDITYAQALCWIGAFFSPLIPAMTAIKLLIFFFAKKETLMRNYKPKPSHSSGTTYFFMIILMITFILCSAATAYVIGRLMPSKSCGPFRFYADENFHMFDALTIAIQSLQPRAQKLFAFIGSWVFYLSLVIVFSFLIIWYQMRSSAHREMVEFLKERLRMENQDKKYLLDRWKIMHAPERSSGATR